MARPNLNSLELNYKAIQGNKGRVFYGLCLFILSAMPTGVIHFHLAFSTRRDYSLLKMANVTVL
jgi:hypothetical protein